MGTALHRQHQPEAPRRRRGRTRRRSWPSPRATARARRSSRASTASSGRTAPYEALLEDPEVDAIYNPLPNSLHVEWSLRALEAGKHVLCEKPLSRRPAEVEEAFAAAERARARAGGGVHVAPPPADAAAARAARRGRGRAAADGQGVVLVPARRRGRHPHAGRARRRLADGRRLLLRERHAPRRGRRARARVRRAGDRRRRRRRRASPATLRFPGDVIGAFHCGFSVGRRHHLEAIGDEASLFLADPWHGASPGIEIRRDDGVEHVEIEAANPYALRARRLRARGPRRGRAPRLGAADALAQARVIEALYRSAESGAAMTL